MININAKIWALSEKLYIHCYHKEGFIKLFEEFDIDLPFYLYENFEIYSFMSMENYNFANYMQRVASYNYLGILAKIFFDSKIISTQYDNWNYYGENIKTWYPELNDLLKALPVVFDEKNKRIHQNEENISINSPHTKVLLAYDFNDIFLDHIKKEINECYKGEQYLAVIILSRKLLEALFILICEACFPKLDTNGKYIIENHELWYNKIRARHQDFDILIKNLNLKSSTFSEDKDLVEQICSKSQIIKNVANKFVHRHYIIPDLNYIKTLNIDTTVVLVRKAYRKYCNP